MILASVGIFLWLGEQLRATSNESGGSIDPLDLKYACLALLKDGNFAVQKGIIVGKLKGVFAKFFPCAFHFEFLADHQIGSVGIDLE